MNLVEYNVVKKDWRNIPIKFALFYPNVYRVGMSCLAIHLLYELLNSRNDVLCERFFLDPNLPLASIESKRYLKSFNIVGFSLQYELDYVNFIKALLESGIPPLSKDRGEGDPIICLGGPAITSNPEPLASFADVIFIGEVEDTLNKFLDAVIECEGRGRIELLENASKIPGIYVPSLNNRVKRVWVEDLDNAHHALKQIIPACSSNSPFHPVLGKSFLLEVSRGCGFGCRFCLEGYNYLPMRFRSFENILAIVNEGLKFTPTNNLIIIGSAAFVHPRFKDILEYLYKCGFKFSIPSLRLDFVDEDVLKLLKLGGQRTPVFAPETASQRLLKIINKRFEEGILFDVAKLVKSVGFNNVKLYFMIGLPGESIEDIELVVDSLRKIADVGFSHPKSIRVSFSFFVPKPNTPFQWFGMDSKQSLKRKVKLIKDALHGDRRFDIRFPNLRESIIQAFISRSGSNITPVLLFVAKNGGSLSSWHAAEKFFKLPIEDMVVNQLDFKYSFPWDDVDIGYDKTLLANEYSKALSLIK
ncbi:MAG: radical SAM protein [archaeon YNP-WB-062]|jgi:radical SAM superfamily enzyme YgiQ (UPF0313 family)|nr:radical SAM protein [Candidatus Culexarchaeum yellowstonense]